MWRASCRPGPNRTDHLIDEELDPFADDSGLDVTVAHYPPGTSKWNKIEHRMFCQSKNWRGRPLESVESMVSHSGSTTTKAGLRIKSALDKNHYDKAIRVSDEELAEINLKLHRFHGDRSYTIRPSPFLTASKLQCLRKRR